MLKIGDDYIVKNDVCGWTLLSRREGKDRKKKPKTHLDATYHPRSFKHIAKAICDKEAESALAEELEVVIARYEAKIDQLTTALANNKENTLEGGK